MNAEVIVLNSQGYLRDLGSRLFQRLKELRSENSYDNLLRVLIKGFYIFFVSQKEQLEFLLHLDNIELVDLVTTHFS